MTLLKIICINGKMLILALKFPVHFPLKKLTFSSTNITVSFLKYEKYFDLIKSVITIKL